MEPQSSGRAIVSRITLAFIVNFALSDILKCLAQNQEAADATAHSDRSSTSTLITASLESTDSTPLMLPAISCANLYSA